MLHRATWVLFVGLLAGLGVAATCYSAEPFNTGTVTIVGIVKAAPRSAVEAATVQVGKISYKLVKDTKGTIVARDANGQKAEIKGTVTERNGVKWIAVTWCALVE
jgi:hypothetical protein